MLNRKTNKITKTLRTAMIASIGATMLLGSNLYAKAPKVKYAGWYMRTKVSATRQETVQSTVTTVPESSANSNKADTKKTDTIYHHTVLPTLQVVFPHYNWGEEDSGDYWSDYRKYKKKQSKQKSRLYLSRSKIRKHVNLSNADLKITLDDAINVNFVQK